MKIKLFALLLALFTVANISPSAAWDIESEVDDFGSTRVFASTYFIPGIGNTDSFDEAYEYGNYFSLMLRCQDRKFEAYMTAQSTFSSSSTSQVKFGNGGPKSWSVSRSSDKEAIFFSKPTTLVASIIKVGKFYVRASGSSGYLTANFDTTGLSAARNTFKQAGCKI